MPLCVTGFRTVPGRAISQGSPQRLSSRCRKPPSKDAAHDCIDADRPAMDGGPVNKFEWNTADGIGVGAGRWTGPSRPSRS